ncbi:MAG: SDR family oxidoreductase [Melioribacteraceae bacterium]|nr:SDR family oxidoreductase [Melioribacteraceae bacterium]
MSNSSFSDIKDKVCVITGACGVFGNKFAVGLLGLGAKVAVIDYKQGRCDECAVNLIKESGGPAHCILANVLKKETLVDAKKEINDKFGQIDVLINGAGGNAPNATTKNTFMTPENLSDLNGSFFGLELDGFKHVFDLNFLGTVLPTMVFAEDMLGRGGSIINISSMNSYRPLTKIPAYSAAKASINNFTEWLAVHLAKANVRVNAIAPGFFLTSQNEFLLVDEKTKELTPRGQQIISGTPLGRFGKPEDLLGTLFYLVSDISKFVTGVVIPVDGGFNAYSGV